MISCKGPSIQYAIYYSIVIYISSFLSFIEDISN